MASKNVNVFFQPPCIMNPILHFYLLSFTLHSTMYSMQHLYSSYRFADAEHGLSPRLFVRTTLLWALKVWRYFFSLFLRGLDNTFHEKTIKNMEKINKSATIQEHFMPLVYSNCKRYYSELSSGVARAFPSGRLAHPEGENEETLRKIWKID